VVRTVEVKVKISAPSITDATAITVHSGTAISTTNFSNTGGAINSCSITSTLPTGLDFNTTTCSISGTPSVAQVLTTYTVTATNATGSDTATVSITVTTPPFIAKDALLSDQWYIKNSGNAPDIWGKFKDLTAGADMNVMGAWNLGVTGKGIVVTVSDDGIDFNHPDLKDKQEGSTSLQTLQAPAMNVNDHGTGCAGIIAALSDTEGIVGIAPKATLISHQQLGHIAFQMTSTYRKILEDNISQISNHSYRPSDDGKLYPQNSLTYDEIKSLVENSNNGKGHVLLFASGNGRAYVPKEYKPSDISAIYQEYDETEKIAINYGDYAGLDMSQNHPFIFCISGFDANNKDVTYAEAGPSVLVAGATGNTIIGTYGTDKNTNKLLVNQGVYAPSPKTSKKPSAAMATTGRNGISYVSNTSHRDGGTDEPSGFNMSFNGTSAATPAVTGVVALIRSANSLLTWRDVRWILAKTARKIQSNGTITNMATGEPSTGIYSKPIWSTTGNSTFGKYSHYFGYGAADATEAVKLAKSSNYKLLPAMQKCTLTVSNNSVTVPASGCPNTIEFVQVKFTTPNKYKINEATYTMQKGVDTGKVARLIVPTTCKNSTGCDLIAEVTAKTGTIAFLGDSLNENDTFSFVTSNADKDNTEDIITKEITIFGYNKPITQN
jgi:subtilisin family serine protease